MQELQTCENCLKQFPESKINSHISYCRRNIKKCPKCNQMIDINYKTEHEQQFHTNQSCQYCKKQFNPDQITKHQNNCSLKPKYCDFCDLNIKSDEFTKHQINCGSRTKPCTKCNKNVVLREYDIHIIDCPGRVIQSIPNNIRSPQKKNIQPIYKNQVPIQIPRRQILTKNIQSPREANIYKSQIPETIQKITQYPKKQQTINKPTQIIRKAEGIYSNQYEIPKKQEAIYNNDQFKKQQYIYNQKPNNQYNNIPPQYNNQLRRPQGYIYSKQPINNIYIPQDANKKNQMKIVTKPPEIVYNQRIINNQNNRIPVEINNQIKRQFRPNDVKMDPKNQRDIRNDQRNDQRNDGRNYVRNIIDPNDPRNNIINDPRNVQRNIIRNVNDPNDPRNNDLKNYVRNDPNDPRNVAREIRDPNKNNQQSQRIIREQKTQNEYRNLNKEDHNRNSIKNRESSERNNFYNEIPPVESSQDIELQKILYAEYEAKLQQQRFLKQTNLSKQFDQLNIIDLSQSMCRDMSNQQAIQASIRQSQGRYNQNKKR